MAPQTKNQNEEHSVTVGDLRRLMAFAPLLVVVVVGTALWTTTQLKITQLDTEVKNIKLALKDTKMTTHDGRIKALEGIVDMKGIVGFEVWKTNIGRDVGELQAQHKWLVERCSLRGG